MKAPSPQLLRALRTAINNNATTHPILSTSLSSSSTSHFLHRTTTLHNPNHNHYNRQLTTSTPRTSTSPPSYSNRPKNPYAPTHRDRGPPSTETTQTDFGALDVFDTSNTPIPATSIDACTSDGFHLDNGVKTSGFTGLLLTGGEAFTWRPWEGVTPSETETGTGTGTGTMGQFLDARRGILNIPVDSLGLLEVVYPKPDLLIIGTGGRLWMLGKDVRTWIGEVLGCRVDVMDTANAAAAYNLLARERGVEGGAGVGGLFLPVGWVGVKEVGGKVRPRGR